MQWTSPEAFFAMGGYGFYGLGSDAVTALFMGLEIVLAVRRHRQARRDAQTLAAQETSS